MAIDVNGLRTALSGMGDQQYVDYNSGSTGSFIIALSNVTALKSEINAICDSYILEEMPRSSSATLREGIYKRDYQI